jgi:hypothetical protein
MNWLRRFGRFWYNFVVGDDWRIAAGVVAGLAIVAALAGSGHAGAWWFFPVLVMAMLGLSLWSEVRKKLK